MARQKKASPSSVNVSDKPLKVAIVHDWLIGGGAERVVEQLHEQFPDAPIYTSYCSPAWQEKLGGKVVTGYLQRWPFSKLRKFVGILRIWWFKHLDLSSFDVVISSTGNGEAKGVRVPRTATHICYCHSPVHYYWRHYEQYIRRPGFGPFDPLARLGLRLLVGPLRRRDYKAAQRPDLFIANSTHIQRDIKQYYDRDAVVIHPPVDLTRFEHVPKQQKRTGFVTVGRLAPAKRTDIVVEACTRLNLPLTVIGDGPDYDRLRSLAGPTITFLSKANNSRASDEEVVHYLASARAFLFASFDDFGIVSIEALAAGTPVIAYKAGGAPDYIEEGKTGLFFAEQTVDSLCAALETFQKTEKSFDNAYIREYAKQFSSTVFKQRVRDLIQKLSDAS
jgi:glycosyltransferase involved in cell wall biosynthesis